MPLQSSTRTALKTPSVGSAKGPSSFNPLLNGLLAGMVMLLSTGGMLLDFHLTMKRQSEAAMRNSLRRAAIACSLTVDPVVHASLNDASQQGSPAYEAACEKLRKALDGMSGPEVFRFVYTCILRGDSVSLYSIPPRRRRGWRWCG